MELLQITWSFLLDSWQTIKNWVVDPANQPTIIIIGLIAAFLAILVPIWAILKLPVKILLKKKIEPETSTAEDIAKAAITSYEQGKQSAASELQQDLAQRDQQIAALTKAVEALQTERSDAETETEQTTIDTALAHLKDGNTSEAEAIFEEILETETKRGHEANKQAASAARHIGALAFLHDTEKALNAYKRAVKLDPDNAEGWNQLGHLQYRIGQLDQAITSVETILNLNNSMEDQALIASALGNLGIIYKTRGDLEKAEGLHLKCLKINEQLGNKKGIANCYGNLGIIYLIRGDMVKAEDAQLKALKIDKQLRNKHGIADCYSNLGNIYFKGNDFKKAENAQLKSLKLNEQLRNNQGIADCHSNLGNIYFMGNDFKKAEDVQLKSLKVNEQLGNKHGMASSYGKLGLIYVTRGDLEKAEDAVLKALKIFEQLDNKLDMANSYGNLGNIYKLKGNMNEACSQWQKALELFTEVGAKPEIELVSNSLKEANCPEPKQSASD